MVGLGGAEICISNELPGGAVATGLKTQEEA